MSTYKTATSYMKNMGIDPKKSTSFYDIVYFLGYSMIKKHVDKKLDTLETSHMSKMLDNGLVDTNGLITDKGENMVKEVNPELYKSLADLINVKMSYKQNDRA